ncbi:NAD-dependent epimerase/dehydratase family protein [Sphaerisporangium album]|uniref:NAD-dependent epimerase/dehydratase family protein n=1 Tax=Sphaerisporangium album TaxID=509200 RepID=A0A367FRQ7_9ACTN|nr:sugar nucleotide-binding protein [Sphaerisporangium album]RCG32904.1 NAD-dependent epimerase/dehydratase family protein [Sphaerisporangium album]
MRFLIVGGSGFLGGELARQCSVAEHEVAATYLTRSGETSGVEWLPLDVRRREDVDALIGTFRPEVVINAAYRQTDWATTATGAVNVALAAAAAGGRLVHVSSDAVFSGAAIRYDETCVPDPITPYGAAKAAAETAVNAIAPTAVIARTSLIVGDGGDSAHEALVRSLATGRARGMLFTDEVRCPVHVFDLAAALLELAASEYHGVHHVAGTDAVSRYELGRLIARRDGLDADRLPSGRRADTNVPRPMDVRLESAMTQRRLRTRLRGARQFLG